MVLNLSDPRPPTLHLTGSTGSVSMGLINGPAGATGAPGPGAVLYNRAALTPWYAALAKRATAQARAVCIGDSISIGAGLTDVRLSWTQLLQARLRTRYSLTNVADGYVPVSGDFLVTSSSVTVNPGGIVQLAKWGLGERNALVVNGGDYAEWAARPYTRIRVWFGRWSNFFHAPLRCLVNGVDLGSDIGTANGTDMSGFFWDSGTLPGNQTVRIVPKTAGAGTFIEGIEFFDGDHASGIHVYNHAQSGWQCTDFTSADAEVAWGAVTTLAPQLLIVYLGTNDMSTNEASVGLANLDALLAKIDAKVTGPHSVLLVGGYRATNVDAARWTAWHEGLVARAVGQRAYLNASQIWPVLVNDGSTNYGLMAESSNPIVHPNASGHVLLADFVANHIVP